VWACEIAFLYVHNTKKLSGANINKQCKNWQIFMRKLGKKAFARWAFCTYVDKFNFILDAQTSVTQTDECLFVLKGRDFLSGILKEHTQRRKWVCDRRETTLISRKVTQWRNCILRSMRTSLLLLFYIRRYIWISLSLSVCVAFGCGVGFTRIKSVGIESGGLKRGRCDELNWRFQHINFPLIQKSSLICEL